MRTEIRKLHQRVKATMIYVTHDQVEAMTLGDRIAVLQKGVLQQVADPFTLYRHPANQFVASFIGSPSINFFRAEVRGGSGISLHAAELAFTLPEPVASILAPLAGGPVTVGVRPEDLTLETVGPGGGIPATVSVREPLGNEVLLHWETPLGPLVSRVPGQSAPAEGERAVLHFEHAKLHFFHPETEQALTEAAAVR